MVQLVEKLFEPELVDLMDDDEEHLIVLRTLRDRPLTREQFVELQVGCVGLGHQRLTTGPRSGSLGDSFEG